MADCVLTVRAVPNASRTEVVGLLGEALKVKLRAVPEDGRANRELTEFFAKTLGVPKRRVSVIGGEKSRDKIVAVEGLSEEEVFRRFGLPRPTA